MRWQGHAVARLAAGRTLARPKLAPDAALATLDHAARAAVAARLDRWLAARLARHVPVLGALAAMAVDPAATPALRVVAGTLEAAGGIAARLALRATVEALDHDERKRLRRAGVTIGALDLFDAALLKGEAARWRRALMAASAPPLPPAGATVLPRGAPGAILAAGFRPLGAQAVRIDLVERIARAAHDGRQGRAPFALDPALATSIGLEPGTLARLMAELGFQPVAPAIGGEGPRWAWRGRPRARAVPVAPPTGAFAALAGLVGHG